MNIDSSVEAKIEEIVASLNFDLYEIKFFKAGGKTVLRIFADSDNGISLDECASISRAVSEYLDEHEFGKVAYTLEVSSPGADRPLTEIRDFRRVLGKKVKIRTRAEKKSDSKISGTVKEVFESSFILETEDGDEKIEISEILSGKIEF
jgi:ribosome maturation factor RimP